MHAGVLKFAKWLTGLALLR